MKATIAGSKQSSHFEQDRIVDAIDRDENGERVRENGAWGRSRALLSIHLYPRIEVGGAIRRQTFGAKERFPLNKEGEHSVLVR